MPFFSEQIIQGILVLSAALFLISVALIIYALGRRTRHEQDFRALDESRRRLRAIFAVLREGKLDYDAARTQASALLRPSLGLGMEQLLIEHLKLPADAAVAKRLANDLGYIARWQLGLRLEPSVRAKNAENLGLAKDRESWELLVRSLNDADADVRRTALRALAAIGDPDSFPAVIQYVQEATAPLEGLFSERDLLAALSCFPFQDCRRLLPLLCDDNSKLRRLALETLTQMTTASQDGLCWLEDAEQGSVIAGLILSPLAGDGDPEIRARAARLLARVKDGRATLKLRGLLNDPAWFVRLHAVRSLAGRQALDDLAQIAAHLSDAHWRVREAAAQALLHQGTHGTGQLVSFFLSTRDAYAREQIAEVLVTSGELTRMLDRCGSNCAGLEFDALKEISNMGKAGGLQPAIESLISSRSTSAIAGPR